MGSGEAMTSERLAEMAERAEHCYQLHMDEATRLDRDYPDLPHDYSCDVDDLLAEVERQRAALDAHEAREAALVEVVEKVGMLAVQSAYDGKWFIPHVHAAHILIEQARALLASMEQQEGGGDGQR